jgi:predicted GNAT family acetyltransferase
VVDGDAVAMCSTVRIPDRATEAGVYTEEPFRGHGYAAAVTAAWAIAIRASGRIPLYSTEWGNAASRRVASKLELIVYGSDFSIS